MLADPNAYFSVAHDFTVFLLPFSGPLPDDVQLADMRSMGLKLLSEVKALESNCLLQLRSLDQDSKAVVDYLKLQSRKIDMVLHYVLENENARETEHAEGHPCQGLRFGGSSIVVQTKEPLMPGQLFKATLYIRDELIALVCIARVSDIQLKDGRAMTELSFERILDADVEQLVKASLSVQQKQLKARKNLTGQP